MTDWQEVKLGDICDVRDGTHDTPKESSEGKYLVTSKHIKGGKIDLSSAYKISLEDFNFVNQRSKVDQWDILISMIGTVGEICLVSEYPDFAIKNVGLIKTGNEYLAKYLYYYLKSPVAQNDILSRLRGTTQQYLPLGEIRDFPVYLPSLDMQKQIAGVLGALDDKIELNNKINNNLEQQAQALFKSWFVDFEPFGGVMPEDWKVGKLEELVDFTNGYAFKSNELENTPISGRYYYDVFKQGHIMRGGGLNLTGTKSYYPKDKSEKLGKYVLKKGDILMAMTDMKGNVAILGNTALINIDDKYILNQRVGLLRCNNEYEISYPYVYILTNSFDFLKDLRNRANSGVQVNLSSSEIKNSDVIIPSRKINQTFNEIGVAIFEKIFANQRENTRLAAIRDALLPKLMSGKIDVSNVDISALTSTDKLSFSEKE